MRTAQRPDQCRGPAVSPLVLTAVLCAALLHAGWNAVLRGGGDRLWSMTLMMVAVAAATAVTAAFAPWPAAASYSCIVASAVIHTIYNLSLVRLYRLGELGQTYPVSRGSSPVLVALGAFAFAGEGLDAVASLGVLLVSGGIVSIGLGGEGDGKPRLDVLLAALATGVLIAAYTVVDGIGVRLAGDSLAYANAMFLLWSLPMPLIFVALRGRPPTYGRTQTAMALAGGLVSIAAYGIVIWAMRRGAMGAVSALRETSVVFAAVIGRLFLGERLTRRRVASCVAIAAGAACLAF